MIERACTFHDRRLRVCCTECGETVNLCQCVEVEEKAFQRLNTDTGKFLRAVWQMAHDYEGGSQLLATAMTELGVVAQKLVQNDRDRSIPDSEVRRELVKLSATLALLAAVGTPEYAYPSD